MKLAETPLTPLLMLGHPLGHYIWWDIPPTDTSDVTSLFRTHPQTPSSVLWHALPTVRLGHSCHKRTEHRHVCREPNQGLHTVSYSGPTLWWNTSIQTTLTSFPLMGHPHQVHPLLSHMFWGATATTDVIITHWKCPGPGGFKAERFRNPANVWFLVSVEYANQQPGFF